MPGGMLQKRRKNRDPRQASSTSLPYQNVAPSRSHQLLGQPNSHHISYGNPASASTPFVYGSAPAPQLYESGAAATQHMSYSQPHLPLSSLGPHQQQAQIWNQGAALCDRIQDRMSLMITAMDQDQDVSGYAAQGDLIPEPQTHRGLAFVPRGRGTQSPKPKKNLANSFFARVWLYSNSRLPPHHPPFTLYMETYPLLCIAAQYSLSVYNTAPAGSGAPPSSTNLSQVQIPASLRLGTKAMLLAMRPLDDSNTIVLAIRGSATFADWAVNFRPSPDPPNGFLDDPGNLVHSGFLAVAKSMISPIAARLKSTIQDDPDRKKSASLLLTGHSAGGAVASLLFCHMLSQSDAVQSELKEIAGLFRRIHCVTFGTPPMSLLPLQKPALSRTARSEAKRWNKSLFYAFVNEGDPVVRADRAFIRSLLTLYTTTPPVPSATTKPPRWKVPANTLSNAGKLVVLRPLPQAQQKKRTRFFGFGGNTSQGGGDQESENLPGTGDERIEAFSVSDEQLRSIVFGDPLMHSMKLYDERVRKLAIDAVTGRAPT